MCTSGIANTLGGGALACSAALHTFYKTVKIGNLTVATTDLIPSLSGYSSLGSPAFTGAATLNGLTILTQDTTVIPAYVNVGRLIEVGCSLANFVSLEFHSNNANTAAVNYDAQAYSSGGTTGSKGQGLCIMQPFREVPEQLLPHIMLQVM